MVQQAMPEATEGIKEVKEDEQVDMVKGCERTRS
jgi:hypothetical protein